MCADHRAPLTPIAGDPQGVEAAQVNLTVAEALVKNLEHRLRLVSAEGNGVNKTADAGEPQNDFCSKTRAPVLLRDSYFPPYSLSSRNPCVIRFASMFFSAHGPRKAPPSPARCLRLFVA